MKKIRTTGVFCRAASRTGWFWSVKCAWENPPQHPPVAAQILHTDEFLSDVTYFLFSLVHPTSEGGKSRLVWENMLTHGTQAETMT